ncbi:MAG TPA: chemotaxis protein CheA, partial [Spirochaetota bacterium]|nr:chemotaxis protein CheA [Spirochaetota bacterium]
MAVFRQEDVMNNQVREVFLEEAKEIIANLETDIVSLEEGDSEIIHNIFRYVHTLKGSSGIAGYDDLSEFTHKLESLLDRVRSGELEVTDTLVDLMLNSIDFVKLVLFNDGGADSAAVDNVREKIEEVIEAYSSGQGGPAGYTGSDSDEDGGRPVTRYFRIAADFKEDVFKKGIDPLLIIEDLFKSGEVIRRRVDRSSVPPFEKLDPERCYLKWEVILKTTMSRKDLDDIFMFVMDDNNIIIDDLTDLYVNTMENTGYGEKRIGEILLERGLITENELQDILGEQENRNMKIGDIAVSKGYVTEDDLTEVLDVQDNIRKKVQANTVRVDTARLDNLLNLLGEIVIGQASLHRIGEDLDEDKNYRLTNALYALDRTTREFQEQLMSIRMIPIGPTFDQFRRFVRDSAHSAGKEISLQIQGRETELDKTVIEKIGDPLKHMIRNAIDHGIETPENRIKAGKGRTGSISLKAFHQEGNIYIEITDDGKGISRQKLREKAEHLGMIKPGEDVPDHRLLALIFAPGFSTVENVGEMSGRGVGMDVVKTNIDELRGNVEIESEEGIGTTIRIKLP